MILESSGRHEQRHRAQFIQDSYVDSYWLDAPPNWNRLAHQFQNSSGDEIWSNGIDDEPKKP
jgi:hypothetical protein